MENKQHRRWAMERRVPPALVFAVLMQFSTALIWATYLEARVTSLEKETVDGAQLAQQFGRLEERLSGLRIDVSDIKRKVDRLVENR